MHRCGFLVHAASGSEIGDEKEHEHAQIAARFHTRRPVKALEEMLRLVIGSCCRVDEPQVWHRVAAKLRGSQPELYNIGYAMKGR